MSKLVELLTGTRYPRLTALSVPGTDTTYSVRNQRGGNDVETDNTKTPEENRIAVATARENKIQSTAAKFFPNTYQTGYNTFKNNVATGVSSFRKSATAATTDFTGKFDGSAETATTTIVAENTYARKVTNTAYTTYGTYTLNRNTYNNRYISQFSNTSGVLYATNLP